MKQLSRAIIELENKPSIVSYGAIAGKKESEGPLQDEFDETNNDSLLGQTTFEKAESYLQKRAVEIALSKGNLTNNDIDLIFAGDLLNQCIGSSFGLRDLDIPFIGLYGACSTMALSLAMAAISVNSGMAQRAVAVTSSHFCSAERQYRFPLEYGGQRTPTAQWTVTGSGAAVVSKVENKPYIKRIAIGKIMDLGVKDANNMGAAMAPGAYDTINRFFIGTGTNPKDYDAIFTGDLGLTGSELLYDLAQRNNLNLRGIHHDCGLMIFDREKQDVHCGGSGCGCSATVLCSHILNKLNNKAYKRILFCATGALLSPTSTMQGESIPCIAHLIEICAPEI